MKTNPMIDVMIDKIPNFSLKIDENDPRVKFFVTRFIKREVRPIMVTKTPHTPLFTQDSFKTHTKDEIIARKLSARKTTQEKFNMRNKKFPRSNSRPRMYQNENNVPPPERYPGVLTTKDIEYIVQNCMNLYGDLVINLKAIRRSIMETPQKEEDVLCIDKSFMEILLNHDTSEEKYITCVLLDEPKPLNFDPDWYVIYRSVININSEDLNVKTFQILFPVLIRAFEETHKNLVNNKHRTMTIEKTQKDLHEELENLPKNSENYIEKRNELRDQIVEKGKKNLEEYRSCTWTKIIYPLRDIICIDAKLSNPWVPKNIKPLPTVMNILNIYNYYMMLSLLTMNPISMFTGSIYYEHLHPLISRLNIYDELFGLSTSQYPLKITNTHMMVNKTESFASLGDELYHHMNIVFKMIYPKFHVTTITEEQFYNYRLIYIIKMLNNKINTDYSISSTYENIEARMNFDNAFTDVARTALFEHRYKPYNMKTHEPIFDLKIENYDIVDGIMKFVDRFSYNIALEELRKFDPRLSIHTAIYNIVYGYRQAGCSVTESDAPYVLIKILHEFEHLSPESIPDENSDDEYDIIITLFRKMFNIECNGINTTLDPDVISCLRKLLNKYLKRSPENGYGEFIISTSCLMAIDVLKCACYSRIIWELVGSNAPPMATRKLGHITDFYNNNISNH